MLIIPRCRATEEDGVEITDTTNTTSEFVNVSGYLDVPANYVKRPGTLFVLESVGHFSTAGSPGSIDLDFHGFGNVLTLNFTPPASVSLNGAKIICTALVKTVGASGAINASIHAHIEGASNEHFLYHTATVWSGDTTTAADLDLQVQWNTASASNIWAAYYINIEEMNS